VWVATALGATVAGAFVAMHPTLGLLAVLSAALVVAMFVRPDVTTLVVVFLVVIDAPSVMVNKYGFPQTFAAVVPLLLVIPFASWLLRSRSLVATPVFALLTLYFIVQLVGTILSPDTAVSLKRVETFVLEGLISYLLVTNVVRSRQELRRATWVVLSGLGALGGLTLVQDVTHRYYSTFGGFARTADDFFYGRVASPRFQGPIGDPNYFAQILVIGVPLGFALAATTPATRTRVIALLLTVFCMAGLVLTYSRGAVVALVFVLITVVALRLVRVRWLLVAVLMIVVAIASIPSYRNRVASIGSVQGASAQQGRTNASSDQSVRERATEMRAALLAFSDHVALGVGPSAFPLVYQHYALQTGGEVHARIKYGPLKGTIPERQAHDLFLSVATDGGTIGLALFLGIIVLTGRGLLRTRKAARALGDEFAGGLATGYFAALVGFLTAGLFLSLAYERYFWLLLALGLAATRVALTSATATVDEAIAPALTPSRARRPATRPFDTERSAERVPGAPRPARARRPIAAAQAVEPAQTWLGRLAGLLSPERAVQILAALGLAIAVVFEIKLLG
jgi:O-antigen ligase